jgi:hypothetical protein
MARINGQLQRRSKQPPRRKEGDIPMRLKHIITAGTIALMPLVAGAASIIVPVAGSGPGSNNSLWQSELTLHNTSASVVKVGVTFRDRTTTKTEEVTIPARGTVSMHDVVATTFERPSTTGGIEVTVPDAFAQKIAVSSRILNVSPTGEFGQDVDAVRAEDAPVTGELSILQAPSSATAYRFNFGVYAIGATAVRWELIRADGTVAASRNVNYAESSQTQYNNGVATFFNVEAKDNDSIHALITEGKAIFYGSAVNNATGDPYYVRGFRTREDIRLSFIGIDTNEDGVVDVFDADHDGVVDQPLDIYTSLFPNYFRLVSNTDGGLAVTYHLVDAPRDAELLDGNGTVVWAPGGDVKGQNGVLKVSATSGYETTILTIPVRFR